MNKPIRTKKKLYLGVLPEIFGYSLEVIAESELEAVAALRSEFHLWNRNAKNHGCGIDKTFSEYFEYAGGFIKPIELGKVFDR